MRPVQKPVNLNEIVATITKLISRLIGENIVVETHLLSSPLTINADCGQIEQVLINLATNARDAMTGGGKLQIATELVNLQTGDGLLKDSCPPGPYALLSVSDTGSGMDEATVARIFEPFFTTKEPGKGTGLGLAILYGIISQHNGFVSVSSRPGFGTTFSVYLPSAAAAETAVLTNGYRPVTGGTETVLIAEDDPAIRAVVSIILQQFGYRVIEAADGSEAEEKFRDHAAAISLVILDTIMPRKNGKETFASIVQIKPGVRMLFISGYPAEVIAQRGLLPEGTIFMAKPISPMALLRNIRQLLDGERVETTI
jgi:CheY-like chemotaxis protein